MPSLILYFLKIRQTQSADEVMNIVAVRHDDNDFLNIEKASVNLL